MVRLAAAAAVGASATAQKGRIPLPASLLICPWGTSADLAGNPVIVNATTLRDLAAQQTRYGFDEVALDFSHNTTPRTDAEGQPLPTPEPLPIAAMGKLSVVEGTGIVFTPTSWTPEGEQYYCGRHYRDLSPTVGKTALGEVNFIHSIALTRAGQISGLHAFSAPGLPPLTSLQHTIMDTPTADYKSLLLAQLGISDESATDEQILAACEKMTKQEASELPEINGLGAPNVVTLETLSAELATLRKEQLVADATRAGKVIALSAENIAVIPLVVLRDLIAKTPATVPLSATTTPAAATPTVHALSADEAAVAKRFGYTAEQFAKI
jgi:phage I-like protein